MYQGCRFSPVYMFGKWTTDGTKPDLNSGNLQGLAVIRGQGLQPCLPLRIKSVPCRWIYRSSHESVIEVVRPRAFDLQGFFLPETLLDTLISSSLQPFLQLEFNRVYWGYTPEHWEKQPFEDVSPISNSWWSSSDRHVRFRGCHVGK